MKINYAYGLKNHRLPPVREGYLLEPKQKQKQKEKKSEEIVHSLKIEEAYASSFLFWCGFRFPVSLCENICIRKGGGGLWIGTRSKRNMSVQD